MKIADKVVHPSKAIFAIGIRGGFRFLNDEDYLKLMYRCRFGKKLNLDSPETFNEKLQWLKIHNRNPLYTKLVDKYEAKQYVADRLGEEYIIPTIGVWDSFDDINFEQLPNQFVLKCTHDSGGLVICRDKNKLDMDEARKKIRRSLRRNYYWAGREWPYKDVKPRIIAEKYMEDNSGELRDYKIFNFDGEPKIIQVDYNRFVNHKRTLYSTDWKYIEAEIGYPADPMIDIKRPQCLEELLKLARQLSEGFTYIRTDFYVIDDKILFGELTFYAESGFQKITPDRFNETLGKWINLPMGGALLRSNNVLLYIRYETITKKNQLTDYKFYCFDGIPRFIYISEGLEEHRTARISFLTMNWEEEDFQREDYMPFEKIPPKPENFEAMTKVAQCLSEGFPFMRVDLYSICGKVYFSEMTLCPCSGYMPFLPEAADQSVGNYLKI